MRIESIVIARVFLFFELPPIGLISLIAVVARKTRDGVK